MRTLRTVEDILQPQLVIEGAGVRLRRAFGPTIANPFDPFLLFDNFAFNDPVEGPIAGFPNHPHRGIETVTYMLSGSVRHRDSLGNTGVIGPGDVQWMTSGRGIMHEEMPRRDPDPEVFGFQLWVNLPASEKMGPPRYQEIHTGSIPTLERNGASIRVIAGAVGGVQGPVTEISAQPLYLDVTMQPGATFSLDLPAHHTAAAYLFEGEATFTGTTVSAVRLAVLSGGDRIEASTAAGSGARFLLFAGAPFSEPIVPYGPFVMNTREEIRQALADLKNGTFVT